MPTIDDTDFDGIFEEETQEDIGGRTDAIIDRRVDAANTVLQLAASLPRLTDVQEASEDDSSDLTETEQHQLEQTETTIRTAHAAGKAAVWVIGHGVALAARGRWYRRTHATQEAWLASVIPEVVPRQSRRWVAGYPLGLEIAARIGEAPVEGQVRELVGLPQQAAMRIFEGAHTVASENGKGITARHLRKLREAVIADDLPEDEDEARRKVEDHARRILLGPIGPSKFEQESNDGEGGSEAAPSEPASIADLRTALKALRNVHAALGKAAVEKALTDSSEDAQKLLEDLHTVGGRVVKRAKYRPDPAP